MSNELRTAMLELLKKHLTERHVAAVDDHTSSGKSVLSIGSFYLSPMIEIYDTDTGNHTVIDIDYVVDCLTSDDPLNY